MGVDIPTTQQQVAQNIANLEGRLTQTTPAADKAYNKVLAVMEAMGYTSLYKYAVDRIMAVLVATARGPDLDALGFEYGLPRYQATAAVVTITLTGTNTTVIPAGTVFVYPGSGALYISQTSGTITAGTVTLTLTAQAPGSSGNLSNGSTLALQSVIAGATGVPTVSSTFTTGTDTELDPAYAQRIFSVQQSPATGSNAASYRLWAQTVAGVVNAYPYAGFPPNSGSPPMRTVFVECSTSIQGDGIAPQGLLTQVQTAITIDPATGLALQDLGLTNSTLYVQAIIRTAMYVQVTGLSVPSGQTSSCQAAIVAALTTYFLAITPFVAGVDPSFGRNDTITNLSVSKIVQGVLNSYGASAQNIGFGPVAGTFVSIYQVAPGEKAKLGGIAYI